MAALEAGKPVATEKPLAGTLADAREMVAAAKKAKARTFVWYNYRRCPAVALAHQLVKEDKIGRIFHVRCIYLQDWGGPSTPLLWRFQKKLAGSGGPRRSECSHRGYGPVRHRRRDHRDLRRDCRDLHQGAGHTDAGFSRRDRRGLRRAV